MAEELQTQQAMDRSIKQKLAAALPALRAVAGKHIDPERLVKVALLARSRAPMIAQCSPESLLMALMQSAEVGLEPNTPLQHAALVPYRNRNTNTWEVQFQPMYRGLVELARRSSGLVSCRARVIHDGDFWEIDEGVERKLVHKPNYTGNPGDPILVYAIAELRDERREWDVMTVAEIRAIQARAKSQSGPWQTDWNEMAKKTVIKRLMKSLPISDDVARAIAIDDDELRDDMSALEGFVDSFADEDKADKGAELAKKISNRNGNKPSGSRQGDLLNG